MNIHVRTSTNHCSNLFIACCHVAISHFHWIACQLVIINVFHFPYSATENDHPLVETEGKY